MENLYIQPTKKTPEIKFETTGHLLIRGRSYLENTKEFYDTVVNWLTEYVKNPADKTIFDIDIEYFNTSSQLWLYRMVEVLSDLVRINAKIDINWFYEEEEVEEVGEDLANLLGLKINFINHRYESE